MRGPPVCLRALTAEEASAVENLARSRTAPARRVERARVIWRASRGETPPAIAAALGPEAETVRRRTASAASTPKASPPSLITAVPAAPRPIPPMRSRP